MLANMENTIIAELGQYVPKQRKAPSKEFIEATYVRKTRVDCWYASERRKQQLHNNLNNAVKAIRNKAVVMKLDANTTVTAVRATDKTIVHCSKLIHDIFSLS